MNRSALLAPYLLSLTFLTVPVSWAQPMTGSPSSPAPEKGRLTHPQPLDPKELLAVQAIGGSILRAKAHSQDTADTADVLKQLQLLRGAIEQGLVLKPSVLTVKGGTPAVSQTARADDSLPRAEISDTISPAAMAVDVAITAQLSNVRQARLHLQSSPRGVTDAVTRSRRNALATKMAELETATREALSASATQRYQRLFALRERLSPRTLREQLTQGQESPSGSSVRSVGIASDATSPTPTLTTLIQHR